MINNKFKNIINKIKDKKIIIITILLAIIAMSILGITIYYLNIKRIKNAETIETFNPEIMVVEIPENNEINEQENEGNTEIDIEDLEKNSTNDKNNATENTNKINSGSTYYIKVNYGANVVTVYTKDAEGNYTVPVKAMICSTGTDTPKSGKYKTKGKWRWIALFGNVYGQYSTQIVGNILFHSVPYTQNKNPGSLEYWEYDKLGTSASMGCVRLKVIDAKWIYDNITSGTLVEFYSDSNPGPLGKPESQKISENTIYRNWDPTDPDINNPWNNINTNNNIISNNTEI